MLWSSPDVTPMSRVCGHISDELRIGASLVVISFKAIRQVKGSISKMFFQYWTRKVFSLLS